MIWVGICPVSWLELSHREDKCLMFISQDGIGPDNWLFPNCKEVSWVRFMSWEGIGPVKLLRLRSKWVSWVRFVSWGTSPSSMEERSKKMSLLSLATREKEDEFPLRSPFDERPRYLNWVRLPSEEGTRPEKLQREICSSSNEVRPQIEEGSSPENLVFPSLNDLSGLLGWNSGKWPHISKLLLKSRTCSFGSGKISVGNSHCNPQEARWRDVKDNKFANPSRFDDDMSTELRWSSLKLVKFQTRLFRLGVWIFNEFQDRSSELNLNKLDSSNGIWP